MPDQVTKMTAYMDNAAGTRPDPRVVEAMTPYIGEYYANASGLHGPGQQVKAALDEARTQVAALIGAQPDEIIFTSSGSEANNLAIKGLSAARVKKGRHIVVSAIEHFSVLQAAKRLENDGWEVTYVPVDEYGSIDPAVVAGALRDDTVLVSMMHANGEVGTVEPIAEIAGLVRERDIVFHTDAIAGTGMVPISVDELGVDALSLAANQFHGPVGAAALYIRKRTRVRPLIDGGIQEGGRRAGTENVAALVGFGEAARLAQLEMGARAEHMVRLRDRLASGLTAAISRSNINGHPEHHLPGNVHIRIEYIEGESMLIMLDMAGIAAASGSACTSRALKASHVLTAMGVPQEKIHGSLLFSLSRDNTESEVDHVIETLPPIVERLRAMSPLAHDATTSGTQ